MSFWFKQQVLDRLTRIESIVTSLVQQGATIMVDLTRITQEVHETTDAEESAIVLLGRLSDLLKQNAADPVAINALADDLQAKKTALAASIVANTPSA